MGEGRVSCVVVDYGMVPGGLVGDLSGVQWWIRLQWKIGGLCDFFLFPEGTCRYDGTRNKSRGETWKTCDVVEWGLLLLILFLNAQDMYTEHGVRLPIRHA